MRCGSEQVTASLSPGTAWEIVRGHAVAPETVPIGVDNPPNYFSSDKAHVCPLTLLEAFSDAGFASAWADPDVQLQDPTNMGTVSFVVAKAAPFSHVVYLRARTAGVVGAGYIEVHVIVCGNEVVNALPAPASVT